MKWMVVVVGEEDGERGTSHDARSWGGNRWRDGLCVEGHAIIHRFGALFDRTG